MKYTLTLKPTDDSAFNIVRNIYECFRMLGDALLLTKGIESVDHMAPINEIIQLNVKTPRSLALIDSFRKMRHSINYYGYNPKKEEAEDAISLAKACFEPLLNAVKSIVEKSQHQRRLL
ncbi:MAG: hypothetical protein V1906_01035 [Candidatus Woesearchaeota archaeon]